MKRIDIVYKKLKELTSNHGITTSQLANELGLSRANVSSDLNRLCDKKMALKEGTKPVYYRAIKVKNTMPKTSLDIFAKSNQSLFSAVEQAKAAVVYPPHGMHMLLFGETGVGKSMFAELIYKYGLEIGKFSHSAPFIVFNCADYANNPQLLVCQLFGTRKGTYTGADTDRAGLIEKADNGILFLDEIHRLPPEGQEMLFTFIDRGTFRRLGETETERKAKVLIISATTENPESSLLKTFIRRIPMIIRIPNLEKRSVDERLNLLIQFLRSESARLGKPIFVSVNSMRSLLGYNCPNNIGQLKTDIQLICAKAYSDYVSGKKDDIRIVSSDLPASIKEGLLTKTNHRQIWNRLIGINNRYCIFDSSNKKNFFKSNEDTENIYEMIDSRVQELKNRGMTDKQIEIEINNDIRSYFKKCIEAVEKKIDFSSIEKFVGYDVINVVNEIIAYSEEKLNRHFDTYIKYGLAVHIHNLINRINRNREIVNSQLNLIRKEHNMEFSVAIKCLKFIERTFDISMPIDEAGFIAMFFLHDEITLQRHKEKVKVIVVAHGSTTASSMANTCNQLLNMDYVMGFNAPLNENPQKIYNRIKNYLKNTPGKSDVLMLVDMGSLTNFGDELQNELKILVKTIPLVSTPHVIEAARKAIMGYPLDYVYQETMNVNDLLSKEVKYPLTDKKVNNIFIITACTTGEGSALTIKNLLEDELDFNKSSFEIIPLRITGKNDIYSRVSSLENYGKVLCIVSSFKTNLNIPHFTLDQIFNGKAIDKIQTLIQQEETFNSISKTLGNMLKNINSKTVFNDIRQFIQNVEIKIERKLTTSVLIGVTCHIGCMIDRLKGNEEINEYPERLHYIQENTEIFNIIKNECKFLNKNYGINISDDEICYISTFFNPDNCEQQAG